MSGGSSVYSPLPQSNSDSDEFSEEELHCSNERQRVINRLSKLQKEATPEVISNCKKQRVINYKQLDNDRDIGIALNGIQLGTDEITVLKPNNKMEKFSTSRKVCFAFSIFLCIFTTAVFLWILPCEIGSCPPPNIAATNSWRKLLAGIELHGPINVVPNIRDGSYSLVFLYRNSFKGENETQIKILDEGVISLLGGSGKVAWWAVLERKPNDIDCNIIDVDLDGLNDCLVVGGKNLLKAIQSLSGRKLWDVHGNNEFESKSCNFSFPVALPDINGDRVADLLTICSVHNRRKEELVSDPKNYFMLFSGLTGTVLGNATEISHCYSVRNFMLEKENLISYTCLDPENEESVKTVPLLEIISNQELIFLKKIRLNQANLRAQHRTNDEKNIFYIQGRRLNLENEGKCPENCNMLITVKDERKEKKNQTVWTMKSTGSFGMIPIIMRFEKFSGFVLKYWHWEQNNGDELPLVTDFGNASLVGRNIKMKERIRRLEKSKSLELELLEGSQQESARQKRMLARRQSDRVKQLKGYLFRENHTFHKIIESVVLIVFNETDSHSVNASQSEIIQICKKRGDCQPDVLLQRHSLHITDLDEDNFQELISYSSSFVHVIEPESTSKYVRWELQSTVQVIRLEAELPKLYDSRNQ